MSAALALEVARAWQAASGYALRGLPREINLNINCKGGAEGRVMHSRSPNDWLPIPGQI